MPTRRVRSAHSLTAYWLVIAFALRALLPQGFMPDAQPFTLKLCPAGMPAQALAPAADPHAAHHAHADQAHADHEEHRSHHQSADQCPFGAASAAIALSHSMAPAVEWLGHSEYSLRGAASDPAPRLHYRPQPRGPPAFS